MILFINACAREDSRTRRLADRLLKKLGGEVREIALSATQFPTADHEFIQYRHNMIEDGDYGDPLFDHAKDFARADTIVVAAPFWDLSFPAVLKQYLEQICVRGITFTYENGIPKSLCSAEKLYYVSTAGGPVYSYDYGFGYVKSLTQTFFGVKECILIKAEELDMEGAEVEAILQAAEKEIDTLFPSATGSSRDA